VSKKERDSVYRRIVCEYGNHYAYIYITDQNGKLIEEEAFRQPFRLEFKEVDEEAKEFFHQGYQWLQDTILWYSTARDEPETPDSEKPPEQ
jgi:hypothetical protein